MIGRVYKIVANQGDEVYVGSTFKKLERRFTGHKSDYKRNRLKCHSKMMFAKYGADNLSILLIAEYKVCDSTHLRAYEQLWINKLKCINSPAIRFLFFKKARVDYHKSYYLRNKVKRMEYSKQWRKNNPEKVKAMQERQKQKQKTIIKCDCGMYMVKCSLYGHKKSKLHQSTINNSQKKDYIRCSCGMMIHKWRVKEHLATKRHAKIIAYLNK